MKPNNSQQMAGTRDVLAAEGGVVAPIESDRDPYERLDDLMAVVEALCPKWPAREPFTGTEQFKL